MPVTGKKQQLIRDVQLFWEGLPKKKISLVCQEYGIARHTAEKYVSMTDDEINGMDAPKNYKTRKRAGNDFVNIIYKMMADGHDDETIYQYLRKSGVSTSHNTLCDYMNAISKENFPNRKRMYGMRLMDEKYPDDVIAIRRNELLRHILTIDPKKEKDKVISENLDIIKEKFPMVTWVVDAFREFHEILMGDKPEKIDEYIERYADTELSPFCNSLKKDIASVRNAIFMDVSSGFVEGNNNKFKLIKRMVYGRSKIVNLTKKCKLAFLLKTEDFTLMDLI